MSLASSKGTYLFVIFSFLDFSALLYKILLKVGINAYNMNKSRMRNLCYKTQYNMKCKNYIKQIFKKPIWYNSGEQ